MKNIKVLLVDDEPIFTYSLRKALQVKGYEITGIANSYQTTVDFIKKSPPDLIIMDIHIYGEKNGIETIKDIHSSNKIPVIFLSSAVNPEIIEQTKGIDNCSFLPKPTEDEFINLLDREIMDLLNIMVN